MAILRRQDRRYENCYQDSFGNIRCYSSAWNDWVRYVVLVLIILAFLILFFLVSCISARRRRRRGLTPFRGTGWLAGRHGVPTYNPNPATDSTPSAAPYYANPNGWQAPAPPYSPPPPNAHAMGNYYASPSPQPHGPSTYQPPYQQQGVELQSGMPQQPPAAYAGTRGGENVYEPPTGPPPGKV